MTLRDVFLMFSVVALVYATMMQNSDNYGPYTVSGLDLSKCPILKENKLFGMNVSMHDNGMATVYLNFNERIKITSLKVSVYNVTQDQKSFIWNYKVKDPCKHIIFAAFIKNYLMADSNCYIKPGVYRHQMNVKDVMAAVFGTSFFYGHYYTKSDLSSKNGVIACFLNTFRLLKK